MSTTTSLRIVIAEDSVLLRAGLVRLLDESGEDVVGAVADGEALLEVVKRQRPQLVIVDVRMPPTHTDYYEDGPNLATMAMNWAPEEPSWWTEPTGESNRHGRSHRCPTSGYSAGRPRGGTCSVWAQWREVDDKVDGLAELRPPRSRTRFRKPVADS